MFDEDGCATQKFIDSIGGTATNVTTTGGTTTTGTTTNAPLGGQQIWSSPSSNSFVVPAGVSSITMKLWGAGGGGGDGNTPPSGFAGTVVGAGGGAGGGGYTDQTLSVTPGETLTVVVSAGGAGGYLNGFNKLNGSNGGDTQVKRGTSVITDATGGSGGGSGYQGCGDKFYGGAGGAGGVGTTASRANGTAATPDNNCALVSNGVGGAGGNAGIGNGGAGGNLGNGIAGGGGRAQFNW